MSGRSITHKRAFDPQLWADFLDYLHTLYPHDTAKYVARDIGGSVRTVEKWLGGTSRPSFLATLALIDAYEARMLAVLLPGRDWVAVAAAEAELRGIARDLDALQARQAAVLAQSLRADPFCRSARP